MNSAKGSWSAMAIYLRLVWGGIDSELHHVGGSRQFGVISTALC